MRLLPRLLLLLLLVFPATVLFRGGPRGEAKESVRRGMARKEMPVTASLKLEAVAAPGPGVRVHSAGLSPPPPQA